MVGRFMLVSSADTPTRPISGLRYQLPSGRTERKREDLSDWSGLGDHFRRRHAAWPGSAL